MGENFPKKEKKNGIREHKAAHERMHPNERPHSGNRKHSDVRTDSGNRRSLSGKEKRRRKKIIQRRILIACMAVVVLLIALLVRAVWKGVSGAVEEKKEAQRVEVEKQQSKEPKIEEATAVITTAGDVIMHKPFLESAVYFDGVNYDYNPIFTYTRKLYENADFTVITPEYALTGGNYSGYPTFCAPDAIAEAYAANGIDLCLLANNHIYDASDTGLQRTMDELTENGLLYTGARKSIQDKNYIVQDIKGIKVGFFNYVFETEKINGQKSINGIPVNAESDGLINSFQEAAPESLYSEVEEILNHMRDEGAEYIIAYMHWGIEYQTEENAHQNAIAQKLCDMGVDALIGSHPHVIQPVDLLESSDGSHKMLCAYAIGNHLSNQRTEYMDGLTNGYSEDGMMVTLTIHRDAKGGITLEKADFIPTWVYHDQDYDDEYFVLPLTDQESLKQEAELHTLDADISASLDRTNSITAEGIRKVHGALPLKQGGE